MRSPATIAMALVAGVAITLVVATMRSSDARRDAILTGIAASDPGIRIAAWRLIPVGDAEGLETGTQETGDGSVGREAILDHLRTRGDAVDQEALAEAARQFVDRGWLPDPFLIEAATARGDAGPLQTWLEGPWPDDPDSLEPVRSALHSALAAEDVETSRLLLDRLFDPRTATHRHAIEAWLATRSGDEPIRATSSEPLGQVVLALALRGRDLEVAGPSRLAAATAVLSTPEEAPVADLGRVPAWLFAATGSASHLEHLHRRADAGDPDATRVLAMLDPERVIEAEQRVVSNRSAPFARRTLAANRLIDRDAGPGDAAILGLLASGPADEDERVHAAAVVAWRGLSPTARRRIEERWLDSKDDRDVRAGILLGTLRRVLDPETGESDAVDTVQSRVHELARSPEVAASVRRTARLASRALGRPAYDRSELDLDVYAARSTRLTDGRVDPDAVLLGLLAGDRDAEHRLVSPPPPVSSNAAVLAREIGWRWSLGRLLRPDWMTDVGEPVPGDEDDLRLWVDLLAARRLAGGRVAADDASGEDRTP